MNDYVSALIVYLVIGFFISCINAILVGKNNGAWSAEDQLAIITMWLPAIPILLIKALWDYLEREGRGMR